MDNSLYLGKNISQQPAPELLQSTDYTYISPQDREVQRDSRYRVLLKDILRGQLRRFNRYVFTGVENELSAANIERIMGDPDEPLTGGLVHTSEKIYNVLLLGKSYPETVGGGKTLSFNLNYINQAHPEDNLFRVIKEFTVDSWNKFHSTRLDIVLFTSGIPFAVIECKIPRVSVEQIAEQNTHDQQKEYILQLYKFAQIVMATNKNAVKYTTAGTPKEFWDVWEEQDIVSLEAALVRYIISRTPTEQDRNLTSLFSQERVMELIRYSMLLDASAKKICRYQQYFAIKEIARTVRQSDKKGNRQDGVVWHMQGSGKSLIMVMLAEYILVELSDCAPKVIIVASRKKLGCQIAATSTHTRLNPAQAASGRNLVELLGSGKADVVTTIINKSNTAERMEHKNFSRDVFLLVDESHRSNYGPLATRMRAVLPNACYIGFIGTPLMEKEKNTIAKFGKLIHRHTTKDGVDDGAIVPLIYEGRFVEQNVDEANIDLQFKQTIKWPTEAQRDSLSRRWSSVRRLTSTDAQIKWTALDTNEHFIEGYQNTGFKTMLATDYKWDAVRYLEYFGQFGDLIRVVVISPPDLREGADDADEGAGGKIIAYWNKMTNHCGDADAYEEAVRNQFCIGDIDILIARSKPLTGFDAPVCQVLYIDKELKGHDLLRAIARTNRLYESKDYGFAVDCRGLIEKLDTTVDLYSGTELENLDGGDLKGVIVNAMSSVAGPWETYTQMMELFAGLKNPRNAKEMEVFLADDKKRENFYHLLYSFGKALNIVLNTEQAYATVPKDELKRYQNAFIFFSKVRHNVRIRYYDATDN